ncbi:cyclin-like protein [Gonapodya prolifera JEL478]|uniref:Cyclin-like protein n=1 Tax=Gonapodya prolifera (strain JEL478) TaxID=1344416 RepID=A0A138ZYT9_GONPJ|nr:cyclin-like protein [Gonapodya prolifera JEL478]|eukprot:KXS09676.1 cyclin-like protein [Gonapodya prolifera JEL478]
MPASRRAALHDGWDEYAASYLAHARADDHRALPFATYLSAQPHLTPAMRQTLVSWLKDVKNNLGLHSHTLALGVYLMDMYLSCRSIPRQDFQLLGIVALFVASKYVDIPRRCMAASNVGALCCGVYPHADIVEMEHRLLEVVNFDLSWISPQGLLALATGQIRSMDGRDEEYGPVIPRDPVPLNINLIDDVLDLHPLTSASPSPASSRSDDAEEPDPTFATLSLPPPLLRLAHGILEKALEHSRFIGLSSCTMAVSSLLAADRLLMLAQRMDRTLLTPPTIFHLLATFSPSSPTPAATFATSIPEVAFHLANVAIVDGLVEMPPLPPLDPPPPPSPNGGNATLLETEYLLSEYDFAPNDDVRREAHSQDPIFF